MALNYFRSFITDQLCEGTPKRKIYTNSMRRLKKKKVKNSYEVFQP